MAFTNNSLFPVVIDGKIVRQLPQMGIIENEISKHVPPVSNFEPLRNNDDQIFTGSDYNSSNLWQNDKPKSEGAQFFPLSFRSREDKGNWFLLPWEPLISIDANVKNDSRSVANYNGTIKDRWALDDYKITIHGAFLGSKIRGNAAETYPREDLEKLKQYLLAPEAIEVKCELLQILNISRITIDNISFPFTKGESIQVYVITAKSDFVWDLNFKKPKKNKPTLEVGTPTGEFEK